VDTVVAPVPPATTVATPSQRRRRWPALVALAGGFCLLAGAVVWRTVAVPALVKFPTDVDQRPAYSGTFSLFVDPATAASLAEPTLADLSVNRRVQALPEASSANRVVVRETITFEVEGLASATQVHQYVMDRSTNANVDDPRAWAFDETNQLDRSGAYWVALPKDLDSASSAQMYKDEIAGVFTARATPQTKDVAGVELLRFEAEDRYVPVTEAYLRSLDEVVPLPRSLTFDQLRPSLIAAGVPVDETLAELPTVATSDDLATLAGLIDDPIPLEYVISFGGETYVEPATGAIVDVTAVTDRISVRPAGSGTEQLLAILERYRAQPSVAATLDALDRLQAEPLPVFEYRYAQDPESAAEIAGWVGDQLERIDLAERLVPLTMAGLGALAIVAGTGLLLRRRASGR
jgi:hypothetical protein